LWPGHNFLLSAARKLVSWWRLLVDGSLRTKVFSLCLNR
jgi:hypothetical protein